MQGELPLEFCLSASPLLLKLYSMEQSWPNSRLRHVVRGESFQCVDSSFSIEWSELTRPMTGLGDRNFHVRRLERGIAVPTSRGHVRNDGPIRVRTFPR